MPRTLTPEQEQARAVQLDHDQAALHLVRQAARIEAAAARAVAAGRPGNEPARHNRVAAYRRAAVRLVMENRPPSLGVPRWAREVAWPGEASKQ